MMGFFSKLEKNPGITKVKVRQGENFTGAGSTAVEGEVEYSHCVGWM